MLYVSPAHTQCVRDRANWGVRGKAESERGFLAKNKKSSHPPSVASRPLFPHPKPNAMPPTTKPASTKTRSTATWTAAAVAVAVAATAATRWHASSRDATPLADAVAVFDETPLPGMFVGGGSNPPRARGAAPWPARVRVERTVLTPRKPGALERAVQVCGRVGGCVLGWEERERRGGGGGREADARFARARHAWPRLGNRPKTHVFFFPPQQLADAGVATLVDAGDATPWDVLISNKIVS